MREKAISKVLKQVILVDLGCTKKAAVLLKSHLRFDVVNVMQPFPNKAPYRILHLKGFYTISKAIASALSTVKNYSTFCSYV